MKKLLLSLFILLGTGFCSNSFGQLQNNAPNIPEISRNVNFYIYGLENQTQAKALEDILKAVDHKIFSVNIDATTQMCIMSVGKIENLDIQELVLASGYKAVLCETLPPAGQRYVFNPDGTWKIKDL